jgi:hypothetical protein
MVRICFAGGWCSCTKLVAALLFASLLLTRVAVPAPPQYQFTHFAGSDGGPGYVEGTGTAARFSGIRGIAIDSAENVYVADSLNRVIRKISAAGVTTTLAGSPNFIGHRDGIGKEAGFASLRAIAVDTSGTVYVLDFCTVRKITAQGVVTTLAGRPGVSGNADGRGANARFSAIGSIVVDLNGNVIVADGWYSTLRRVAVDGTVTTIVGEPWMFGFVDGIGRDARLSNVNGMAIDRAGVIYICEGDGLVRKITPDLKVTRIAGQLDNFGFPIYGYVDGPGLQARLQTPKGIAVDSGGTVYFTQEYGQSIRKIAPDGVVSTWLGSTDVLGNSDGSGLQARFSNPEYLAASPSGAVYITESVNTIRRASASGSVVTFAGKASEQGAEDGSGNSARFNDPRGLAIDSAGNLYVADTGNSVIRKVTPSGIVETIAGTAGQVGKVDGAGAVARFSKPQQVGVDSVGRVYVLDTGNRSIRIVSTSRAVTTLSGNLDFDVFPSQMAVSKNGNVYLGELTLRQVWKISPTYEKSAVTSYNRSEMPQCLAVDSVENLYLLSGFGTQFLSVISPSLIRTTLAGPKYVMEGIAGNSLYTGFPWPSSMSVAASGRVFVTDSALGSLSVIETDGTVYHVAGGMGGGAITNATGSKASFSYVASMVTDSSGTVYVLDRNSIRKGVPSGASYPAPVIVSDMNDVLMSKGDYTYLRVFATDATSYQWYKDGVPIEGAVNSRLGVSGVVASAGKYYVIVSGPGGTSTSRTFSVALRDTARLINISTRAYVGTDFDVLIAGFILTGTKPKTVLIRAAGPALSKLGVSGVLTDPTVELYSGSTMLQMNDDWASDSAKKNVLVAAAQRTGAFAWEEGSRDAALVVTLDPGAYTAIVKGKSGATGIALVEVYDADVDNRDTRLSNISSRALVRTGDALEIAGFVIQGSGLKNVVIRASGPALQKFGVAGVLQNPGFAVHKEASILSTNDNWDLSLWPTFDRVGIGGWEIGSKDAAVETALAPGAHTVVVSGTGATTGIALVEVFEAD